jgi:kumamolisin
MFFHSGAHAGLIALLLGVTAWSAQAANPAWVSLDNSFRPVPATPGTGPLNPHRAYVSRATLSAAETQAEMPFEVNLQMRNFDELQARVRNGEHVPPSELVAKYEPLVKDYDAVTAWLTSKGLTITQTDPHHMAIFAKGTVKQIQQATGAAFARVNSHDKEYTSAITAPSAPASISPLLIGINGLQPHLRPHRHLMRPSDGAGSAPYSPQQIEQAYQATNLYSNHITGTGQTIAIVIDTFPAKSDLVAFWNAYGINQSISNITFVQAVSGTLPAPSGEETLDTEWCSAIAPGAKVRVYAATDLSNIDLDTAYQKVYTDVSGSQNLGIHQMSMSYGEGEGDTTRSQMQADDQYFVELANAGVTCFAASGDGGSTPGVDASGNVDESGSLAAESPASDPYVTGVGGTTLTLSSSNNESTEVVWNSNGGASGGGTSSYFNHPSWQNTPAGVSLGAKRLVPDISSAADPSYAADYYFTDSTGAVESAIGGTSWSCPTLAGFCALMNEAMAHQGLSPLGVLGPHIYPLIGTTNFRDIRSGNNATPTSNGLYTAGTGYDEATGVGVPLMQTLTQTLAGTQTLIGVGQASPLVTVNQGDNASITVTATGSPIGYQWQRMPVGSTLWGNLSDTGAYSGSTAATLTVTGTTAAMSGDQFQCVVTYSTATVTSDSPTALIVETPLLVSTLAGDVDVAGLLNDTGSRAKFNYPTGIAVDSSGNVFVADLQNNVIRKVTPAGVVSTPYGSLTGASGSTNSTGNNASFNFPRDIAIDTSNNLYVADEGNNLIRKITVSNGLVSSIGTSATFNSPRGVAVDSAGNVYVADSDNNVIRKITTAGTVSILAGSSSFTAGYADGVGTIQALFNQPIGIAVDSSGNVYVDDYGNEVIRKITPGGTVSTLAGKAGVAGCLDGTGTKALFNAARGITVDSAGNLYVTDSYPPVGTGTTPTFTGNDLLRKITPAGVVTTLAGQAGVAGFTNSLGSGAQFFNPCGVTIDSSGKLYVADASNNTIRLAQAGGTLTVTATLPYAYGPAAGQFTVTRTGSTASSVAVDYSIAGTAVSGTDYTALSGSVTIAAGATSATIPVNALSNPQATSNQTVQLTLTDSSASSVINSNPATVTIVEGGQTQPFSDWIGNYPVSSQPSATPENDGVPNLLKYLFDINPGEEMTAADRAALPTPGIVTNGSTSYLTLTYRESMIETGVAVNVQTSFDCKTWIAVTNPTTIVTGFDATTQDPILQVQVPIMASPQFIRLNVTQP